jgi:hypothetical protein
VAALACVALCVACDDENPDLQGKLLVGTIAAEDGTAVGLAIEFLRTSGAREDVDAITLQIVAQGDQFLSATGPASILCLRFPASGRLSLLAQDGKLDASSRISLTAHYPSEPRAPGAAVDGRASDTASDAPSCTGLSIDDAVWPTRGAQVIPIAEGTGGSGNGGSGVGGSGGAGGGAGAGGSGGAGATSSDAGPDSGPEPDAGDAG